MLTKIDVIEIIVLTFYRSFRSIVQNISIKFVNREVKWRVYLSSCSLPVRMHVYSLIAVRLPRPIRSMKTSTFVALISVLLVR